MMSTFFHYVAIGYYEVWGIGLGFVVGLVVLYVTRDLAKPLSWLLATVIAFLLIPGLVGVLWDHWQQVHLPFS